MSQVVILDAGSQFGKKIDQKVRGNNAESEIFPIDASLEKFGNDVEAIIVSGGPNSVTQEGALSVDKSVLESGLPILWICYGFQLLNHLAGGKAEQTAMREDGAVNIKITKKDSLLFQGLDEDQEVLMAHGDSVTIDSLGEGLEISALSENGFVAAIEDTRKKYYGVQFHPETDITENGSEMISNFLDLAGVERKYTMEDREKKAIEYIRETVGDKKVLCLCSGGVDSTVLAVLLGKALPSEQIEAVHIDNGFMRSQESEQVKIALKDVGVDLKIIDGTEYFLNATTSIKLDNCLLEDSNIFGDLVDQSPLLSSALKINEIEIGPLKAMVDPEAKRKIIGDAFMRISDVEIKTMCKEQGLNVDDFVLAQGTLRPDLIESGSKLVSGNAETIKTHHNDTDLVRAKRDSGQVIEPLKDYHKNEVRELGTSLGISDELIWRQPFPGPGLAIRILCIEEPFIDESFDSTNELLNKLTSFSVENSADIQRFFPNNIIPEEIQNKLIDISKKNMGATLLPIKTVGVQGDGRTYSYAVSLSGNEDWEDLFFLSKLIPKLSHNINRVVYSFGDKIEGDVRGITPTHLGKEICEKLRKADKVVNDILLEYDLIRSLSQVPVVLVPLPFGEEGNHSIVIRTFITNDFMTGVPAVPGKDIALETLEKMRSQILQIDGISKVMFDLTSKPPGTTEWE